MDILDKLSDFMMEEHPRAAARTLVDYPDDEVSRLIENLSAGTASVLLQHMPQQRALDCLSLLDARGAGAIIDAMSPDVASRILIGADGSTESTLLKQVRPAHVRAIATRARLREDTIGAFMESTPSLTGESTISDARDYVTQTGYPYVYVVDDDGRLIGVVNPSARWQQPTRKLSGLMTSNVECLNHQTPIATVRNHPVWSRFDLVPVVDAQKVFVGVLRHKVIRKHGVRESDKTGIDTAIATLLDLSRLYWSASTHMMLGPRPSGSDASTGGTHDE